MPCLLNNAKTTSRFYLCPTLNTNPPFVFSKWSTSRPGVAMTTWGFLAKASCCEIISMPPVIHAHDSPIELPNAWNCSRIWKASSRVGVNTSTDSRDSPGASSKVCKTLMVRGQQYIFPYYVHFTNRNTRSTHFVSRSKVHQLSPIWLTGSMANDSGI